MTPDRIECIDVFSFLVFCLSTVECLVFCLLTVECSQENKLLSEQLRSMSEDLSEYKTQLHEKAKVFLFVSLFKVFMKKNLASNVINLALSLHLEGKLESYFKTSLDSSDLCLIQTRISRLFLLHVRFSLMLCLQLFF